MPYHWLRTGILVDSQSYVADSCGCLVVFRWVQSIDESSGGSAEVLFNSVLIFLGKVLPNPWRACSGSSIGCYLGDGIRWGNTGWWRCHRASGGSGRGGGLTGHCTLVDPQSQTFGIVREVEGGNLNIPRPFRSWEMLKKRAGPEGPVARGARGAFATLIRLGLSGPVRGPWASEKASGRLGRAGSGSGHSLM